MIVYLYYLADPRFPRWPRYVGITQNPPEREHEHGKRWSTSNPRAAAWKKALRADGVVPRLHVFAAFPDREAALEAEWRIIDRWRRRGLCDANTGDEGGLRRFALLCRESQKDLPKPAPRLELGTARLRIECSTTELSRPDNRTATRRTGAVNHAS